MTLARYGDVTLDEARDLAKVKIGEIAKGDDPAESRRQQRRVVTWEEFEKVYLERHAIHKKSLKNDRSVLEKHLSQWRTRRLTAISRADVCALHTELGAQGHKVAANGMVRIVRSMFNRAIEWGLHVGENPAAKIKLFKEVPRERFVTPTELPRLWKALQKEPNPYIRGAFFVGLLTGARRSEVLGMRWQDLDLEQAIWTIPDTKAGRSHYIPLPKPVVMELLKLPKLNNNPYVFPGRHGHDHLVTVGKNWKRIRSEARLNDVRVHDLRRTLASWLVAAGASLPLIGKTLGHSQPSTTQIYARLQLDPVREALEQNAARMLTYAKPEKAKKAKAPAAV